MKKEDPEVDEQKPKETRGTNLNGKMYESAKNMGSAQVCNNVGQDKSRKRALSTLWTEVCILVETVDGRPNLRKRF